MPFIWIYFPNYYYQKIADQCAQQDKEKRFLTEASQYIDSQIENIKTEIEKGPTSNLDEYNEVVETYYKLTTSDQNKWLEQIPSDIPFYNDFVTYWNTYLSNELQDANIFIPYTDWTRESFIVNC